jgi:hypothetical protein
MDELTYFIGGRQLKGASGRFVEGFEPMTGRAIWRMPLASKEEVRAAVVNASAAQPAWAATNPQRRAHVLMSFSISSRATWGRPPNCWRKNTERRSPTPMATFSAASRRPNSRPA